MNAPAGETFAAALLMPRVAAELLRCQEILRRVEHAVHDMVLAPTAAPSGSTWQKNMQDLDLLDQSLGDLALCLTGVASGALDLNEILEPLRLESVRDRLKGSASVPGRDHIVLF